MDLSESFSRSAQRARTKRPPPESPDSTRPRVPRSRCCCRCRAPRSWRPPPGLEPERGSGSGIYVTWGPCRAAVAGNESTRWGPRYHGALVLRIPMCRKLSSLLWIQIWDFGLRARSITGLIEACPAGKPPNDRTLGPCLKLGSLDSLLSNFLVPLPGHSNMLSQSVDNLPFTRQPSQTVYGPPLPTFITDSESSFSEKVVAFSPWSPPM